MNERELCEFRFRRLLHLLEEESDEITHVFQGDILTAYKAILIREQDMLSNALTIIRNIL